MTTLKVCSFNVRGIRDKRKRRKLFTYFHRNKFDFILLQETHSLSSDVNCWSNEWGGKAFYSHGSNLSRGVAILINPSVSFSINHISADTLGRYLIIILNVHGESITLINVYGPNIDGTSTFNNIYEHLHNNVGYPIIWGGDFNFVFDLNKDKKGGLPQTNFNARDYVLQTMHHFDLRDIWRDRNPNTSLFTWHSNIDLSIYCRLDFFLISSYLNSSVVDANILPLFGSDHSCVTVSLLIGTKRGPGIWKLNTSLLSDNNYVTLINNTISHTITDNSNLDPASLWELCKFNIKSDSIDYSKKLAKSRRLQETALIRKICSLEYLYFLSPHDNTKKELDQAKEKLSKFYDFKLQGIFVRSRARWVEEGEKNTKYFLNLEKRNKLHNTIKEIINDDNVTIYDPKEILNEAYNFYSLLYAKDHTVSSDTFFRKSNLDIPRLNDQQKVCCEGLLTLNDCTTALFSMPLNKSPGTDGLPSEFYRTFWNLIGDLVVNSFNYSFHTGSITSEQGRACISLLPKPSKDHRYLKIGVQLLC